MRRGGMERRSGRGGKEGREGRELGLLGGRRRGGREGGEEALIGGEALAAVGEGAHRRRGPEAGKEAEAETLDEFLCFLPWLISVPRGNRESFFFYIYKNPVMCFTAGKLEEQ